MFLDVIVSLVRTRSIGFLSDASRLELALTRSSDNLIILGSAEIFASSGGFFESLVTKFGTNLKLQNGTSSNKFINNWEDLTSSAVVIDLIK